MVDQIPSDAIAVATGATGAADRPRRAGPHKRITQVIEERVGRPIAVVLQELADSGMSRQEVAEHFGVSREALRKSALVDCPNVQWPRRGSSRRQVKAYESNRELMIQRRKAQKIKTPAWGDFVVPLEIEKDLWALAVKHDMNYHIIMSRYRRGKRGAALVAQRKPTELRYVYRTGLPLRRWEKILPYAREHGPIAMAERYPLPLGAILAMLGDEEELVD